MSITQNLADIYMAAPSGLYAMPVVLITHSALRQPLALTNTTKDFRMRMNQAAYNAISLPFTIKMPDKDTSGSQEMEIVFSNREQNLIHAIELMSREPYEPAICYYNVYINGKTDSSGQHMPQYNPTPRYDINTFAVDSNSIVAVATKTNMHNRQWPRVVYNGDMFPGLQK